MDSNESERPRVEDLLPASITEFASAAESVNAAEKRRMQAVKPSYADRRPLELTAKEAHEIWGHPSSKVISKLEQSVDGVKVKEGTEAPTWQNCTTCIEAKLHKFKSRRPPREPATRPFERLAIDLVQLRKTGKRCYNGDVWLFHAVCQYCKLHLAACLPNKSAPMLLTTLERLLARIETQYGVKVRAVKIDGDPGFSLLRQFFLDQGMEVELRAPYTEEQNGLIEIAGATIIVQDRAIRIGSGLPKELAKVMLTENIWVTQGLVNGRMGYVRNIVWGGHVTSPRTEAPNMLLLYIPGYTGPCYKEINSEKLVPIFHSKREFMYRKHQACTRTQLPLVLAYAITVHKSQGISLDKAVLNITDREFVPGLT
jgi:hypothetical protein